MTYANTHANGATMADWAPITTFTAGSIYEVTVTGANAHPFHVHVNPYQITAMPETSYSNGYFQIGDWHDTLLIADMGGGRGGDVTVRMLTDTFTGKMVLHCHILAHEDEGMMAFIQIDGSEGATLCLDTTTTTYTGTTTTSTTTTYTGTTTTTTYTGTTTTTSSGTTLVISATSGASVTSGANLALSSMVVLFLTTVVRWAS
jgi:hypothetical protein